MLQTVFLGSRHSALWLVCELSSPQTLPPLHSVLVTSAETPYTWLPDLKSGIREGPPAPCPFWTAPGIIGDTPVVQKHGLTQQIPIKREALLLSSESNYTVYLHVCPYSPSSCHHNQPSITIPLKIYQNLQKATRNKLPSLQKPVKTKPDFCIYFFLKGLEHGWDSEVGETVPSEKTSFLDRISSTKVNPGWRAHTFLKPDLHLSFRGSVKCLFNFFLTGKIAWERWGMWGLALALSFNTLPPFSDNDWVWVMCSGREGKRRRELMNQQEMVEWETELMSRRAALLCLPIDTVRPLKKDIVCTCFLAFNNTTLWPICRSFHTTQLTPFPSGVCRCPWNSLFSQQPVAK